MDDILKKLTQWGCDTDGALERFLFDREMYEKFLYEVADDENLIKLKTAFERGDFEVAFGCAHTLKGIHGNMGLTPLYELDIEIVENLRGEKCVDIKEQIEELIDMNRKLVDILNK